MDAKSAKLPADSSIGKGMSAHLDNIRVVLVNTSHPGNIGATARAMKIMDLKRLYLVAPKLFPHEKAVWRSVGAADLLDNAVVVDSLDQAIADCGVVVGASARQRRIPWPLQDARSAAASMVEAASAGNQVAVVFGREDSGLSNEELHQCHFHLTIPTSENYSALNLAAAVQVVAYEILMASHQKQTPVEQQWDVTLANADDLERLLAHYEQVMIGLDFYDPSTPKQLMTRLRRLFMRSRLDKMEINILRGMLGATEKMLDQRKP
jgi:tRNA (cytidine32/uridine32-2'-O)-methyltransferase